MKMKMPSFFQKLGDAFLSLACVATLSATECDWEKINRQAFEHSLVPVALPERDHIPYWNMNARQFIMPPAFNAPEVPDATEYLFTLRNSQDAVIAEMKSASPHTPLTEIWGTVPVGNFKITITALDAQGTPLKEVFQRECYRAAWFHGPYPATSHDYRGAALHSLEYIYNIPHVQAWLKDGTVDEKIYRKYCYPSKTLSALIEGLLLYADLNGTAEVKDKSLTIARKMADWLIDNSCPEGTPLEFLPPTYWKYATYVNAKPNIGQIMMIYPPDVGNAYLLVYHRSGDKKYLDAAERIGRTMKKLELPGGSWKLKFHEKDGTALVDNIVLITRDMVRFFNELTEITGDKSFKEMSDRAYQRLLDHNLKLWDWDGQFEDVIPRPMYENLTKNHALKIALDCFDKNDKATALRIIDWTEDQFVVWDEPAPGMDLKPLPEWRYCTGLVIPMVVEQYLCNWPVDSSMGEVMSSWVKAYQNTGDPVYLEKAKAMGDALLRNQRDDGSFPTWYFTTDLPDWLNCTVATIKHLLLLDEALH